MCFVNSQNVRDLRQPFGGTKASGTGREGGTWSYEVFLRAEEHRGLARRPSHSALGRLAPRRAGSVMSLYGMQKFLFALNREPARAARATGTSQAALLADYDLDDEEREAIERGDIGKIYVLGSNGQLLMHFAAAARHGLGRLPRRRCAKACASTARCAPASTR